MNPSTLKQLSNALRERLSVIADHDLCARDPVTHLKKLQEASEAIEQWEKVLLLEKNVSPQLRHYLAQRSYDKALAWVEEKH